MSDKRHLESVSDSPDARGIDRELADLLSIAPSPEFATRVRQRIQEDRTVDHVRGRWWLGLAAAATIVLAAMFALRAWRTEDTPRETRAAVDVALPSEATPQVAAAPAPAARAVIGAARPPRVTAARARTVERRHAEPEVLVSGDQLRAIARLQHLMRSGQLTEESLPPAADPTAPVRDIQAAPLTIAPLTLPPVEFASAPAPPKPPPGR